MDDVAFNRHLERFVEITRAAVDVSGSAALVATVYVVETHDRVELMQLVRAEGVSGGRGDRLDLFRDFGAYHGRDHRLPQAVFAALHGEMHGNECVVITGATPDGRVNAAHLYLLSDADGVRRFGRLHVVPSSTANRTTDRVTGRIAAQEVLHRWRTARSAKRWWRFW